MKNCFVTALEDSADNNNLPILGELLIVFPHLETPSYYTQRLVLSTPAAALTLYVVSGGLIRESVDSPTGEKSVICPTNGGNQYFIDENTIVSVRYKKDIKNISFGDLSEVAFDLDQIKNIVNLQTFSAPCAMNFIGSLSAFSNMLSLNTLRLKRAYEITGNLSYISGCTSLQKLYITGYNDAMAKVLGDFSSLDDMANLQEIDFSDTYIYGNIDEVLNNNASLKYIDLYRSKQVETSYNVSGDLSKAPASFNQFIGRVDLIDGEWYGPHMTWETERPSTSKIIAIKGAVLDEYLDDMLVNQANCNSSGKGSIRGFGSDIVVFGTHTKSDNVWQGAVATLKSLGYTVTINNSVM